MGTRAKNAETGLKGQRISGAARIPVVEGGEVGEYREHADAYKMGMNKQKMEQIIDGVGSKQAV